MSSIFTQTPKMVLKSLNTTLNLLTKIEEYCKENNLEESTYLQARLAADMFPFIKQIQMITDNSKGLISRITLTENPKYEDTESTISELKDRVNKTIQYIKEVPLEKYSDSDKHKIVLPFMPTKYQTSLDYVTDYGLPNLYFHVVTAYSILRNQGIVLGKMDYINGLNLQDLES